jgi:hypothetical protein
MEPNTTYAAPNMHASIESSVSAYPRSYADSYGSELAALRSSSPLRDKNGSLMDVANASWSSKPGRTGPVIIGPTVCVCVCLYVCVYCVCLYEYVCLCVCVCVFV